MPTSPEQPVETSPKPQEAGRRPDVLQERTEVIQSLRFGHRFMQDDLNEKIQKGTATPEDSRRFKALDDAIKGSVDQGKTTYTSSFQHPETGERVQQEEGVLLEELFDMYDKKLADPNVQENLKEQIRNSRDVLLRNSKQYALVEGRDISVYHHRLHREAYLIATDS